MPLTEGELREERQSVQPLNPTKPSIPRPPAPSMQGPITHKKPPSKVNLAFSDLIGEPDSLKRQKEALFRYAGYLKRLPSLDEGMQLFLDHSLFTGSWDHNFARRRAMTRETLNFTARTFDAGKCANGSVNVGKYDAWAANSFPNGLIARNRSYMTEEGNVMEACQGIRVSAKFIAVFVTVAEFALIIDKNQDDSLPHDGAHDLWDSLYAKGLISVRFCARKWAVCREEFVRHGIIAIIDRNYEPNKAMKWAPGRYFPFLALWKGPKSPSLLGPVVLRRKKRRRKETHKTLLQSQSVRSVVIDSWRRSRPPPLVVDVS